MDWLSRKRFWKKLAYRVFPVFFYRKEKRFMSRICFVTGKKRVIGSRISRKGQSKKSGGIGTHVTKKWPRIFKPNLQRVKIKLPSGQVRRVWVSVKTIKAALVQKVI